MEHWALPTETTPSQDALLIAMSARVLDLMLHRPQKLTTALYTLDVSETKFEDSLMLDGVDTQAEAIAQLIIDREAQKLASWKRYQDQKEQQPLKSLED